MTDHPLLIILVGASIGFAIGMLIFATVQLAIR